MLRVYNYDSYEKYVEDQTAANKKKIHWEFKKENHVQWIKSKKLGASNIICHGTRNGGEQKVFKKYYPDAYIIGTEISETANQFDMTVQHDFTKQKSQWIAKFDILYSNAFDHSFEPVETIKTWKEQLSYNGKMFIEWSGKYGQESTQTDPVSGTVQQVMDFLISQGVVIEEFNNEFGLLMCSVKNN